MQDQEAAKGANHHRQEHPDQDAGDIDFPWEALEHPGPRGQNPGPHPDTGAPDRQTASPHPEDGRPPGDAGQSPDGQHQPANPDGPPTEREEQPRPGSQHQPGPEQNGREQGNPPAPLPQGSFEALKRDLNAPIPARFLHPQPGGRENRHSSTGPGSRAPVGWTDMATYLDSLTSKHSASWDYHVVKSRESDTHAIVTSRITVTASDGRAMTRESLGAVPLNRSGQTQAPAQEEAERIAFVRAALMLGVKVAPMTPPDRQNQQHAKRS